MLRVGIVSSILPETNYTAYLISALQKTSPSEILVFSYCEKDERNKKTALDNLRLCWNRDWRYVFQVIRQARSDQLDLLHFQHEINMFGGPRTTLLFPLLVFLSRIFGFKPVITFHAAVPLKDLNEDFLKVFEWPNPRLLSPMVRLVFPAVYYLAGLSALKIFVHSPGLKEILVGDYHLTGSKIEVIPHGVPGDIGFSLDDVSPRIRELTRNKKFILYFGYFHRRKGLETLIRAFGVVSQKFSDVELILGGGTILPNYAKELQELTEGLSLSSRIHFTGFLSLPELRCLLSNCEFVVLPAIYSIAGSGPLSQAFAHEKPVIVSDLGVFREEIQEGFNGLLAKVGDVDDLVRQMTRLLSDTTLRAEIVKNLAVIRRERSWTEIAKKTAQIYFEVCRE